ncbi:Rfe UDP-N-acetylmuramyl pentapeptide phosphotransferase/UDP-N- acetylglucosamine-1-phosphate transferase [Candidatus Pelagibacterales bacterium]
MILNLIIIFSVLNFFLFFYYKKISKIIKIYDIADSDRKSHKGAVPVLGGTFLLINLLFISIIFVYNPNFYQIFFNDSKILIFFLTILGFYLLGITDDSLKISANYKLIISIILLLFLLYFDNTALITTLNFSFFKNQINFGVYSSFLSVLCYLLFINAFNMIDGINGQAAFYALFIFCIFFVKKILPNFSLVIIIFLTFYLYFNLKGKIFFGDNGSFILSFLLSYILVKDYNLNKTLLADEIFLVMCVPGYDMLRLFFLRIIKRKHPFNADNFHIHHIIMSRLNNSFTLIVTTVLFIVPYVSYMIFNIFYFSFVLSIIFYCAVIYTFSKKITKNV